MFIEPGSTHITIRLIRISCWLPTTTNTHTQIVSYSLLSHSNNDCTTAPQCYAIRTLAVLLQSIFILYFIVIKASCSVTVKTTIVQLTVSLQSTGTNSMRFQLLVAVFWDNPLLT